ncbi:MAG: putative Ig domain-containing protein [Acetobacteraceae bacterium]|nr:putative Ig domain-containing protein [Acetobacteraceae bacterium]
MPITETKNAFVDATALSIGLSQMCTVTAGSSNPTYLVLTALDRNEYTAAASRATGSLSGNGRTAGFASIGGDGRGAGIVFTYQVSTGRYYNSTYGYFDQLTYNASGSFGDVTNLSLFGTNSLSLASSYATNATALMQVDAAGYLGSATVVTQPHFTGTVPSQATPNAIASIADSFVGQAWNMDGCWVLASTIAAEAGASLPVQSTLIGLPGQANGEWIVAFNGPAGQTGNWQSMVTAGEMVVIGTPGGGGHITTCVSGAGSTAMLVDNITYMNASGQVQNSANDGSSADVIVAAPHAASQEWSGVQASSVVIYELDTPIVAAKVSADSLAFLASQSLASLFAATDPANKAIVSWQVYDTAISDAFVVGGIGYSDRSAASALTASSLSSVALRAGSTATTDTLEVRAFNGSYWGDWTSLNVAIAGAVAAAPVLAMPTSSQIWTGGRSIALALPAATFKDPQGQALTYTAHLANGQALPTWLNFNAATDTFTGTAPTTAETIGITVVATDTGGLSVGDTFSATVIGAPVVTAQTANQTWIQGKAVTLALPANTFTDPQGQHLAYTAALSTGGALPTWLTFNAATETFSGTAPVTAQSLALKVTATDTSGLAVSENFTASVQPAPAVIPPPGISLSAQTPDQIWTDGKTMDLVLPSNTFTDALGLKMAFTAYQVAGPNITSWLRFNATTDAFSGTVPTTASFTVGIAVVAADAQHMSATDMFSLTFAASSAHTAIPTHAASFGETVQFNPSQAAGLLAFHI